MTEDITQLSLKKSSWIAGGRWGNEQFERFQAEAQTTVRLFPVDRSATDSGGCGACDFIVEGFFLCQPLVGEIV
jgi:hypothetical protein